MERGGGRRMRHTHTHVCKKHSKRANKKKKVEFLKALDFPYNKICKKKKTPKMLYLRRRRQLPSWRGALYYTLPHCLAAMMSLLNWCCCPAEAPLPPPLPPKNHDSVTPTPFWADRRGERPRILLLLSAVCCELCGFGEEAEGGGGFLTSPQARDLLSPPFFFPHMLAWTTNFFPPLSSLTASR